VGCCLWDLHPTLPALQLSPTMKLPDGAATTATTTTPTSAMATPEPRMVNDSKPSTNKTFSLSGKASLLAKTFTRVAHGVALRRPNTINTGAERAIERGA
jgi:hypothetical protein